MPKLTKTVADAAAPKSKPYFIWCSDLKGFGMRVYPSGSKVFYADYRNADGIRRRMKIGPLGTLTVQQARAEAGKQLTTAITGDDPLQERRTRRQSLTVADLCDRYMEAADKGLILGKGGRPKKASTLATDRGRIDKHIKPLLGNRLVIDIKRADVVTFIRDVQAGKTRVTGKSGKLRGRVNVRGGPGTAARTAGTLGGILSFAVSEGVIEFNPSFGVKKPAGKKRDRRLSPDEYRALGKAFANPAGKPWQGLAILHFAALSGCRLGEVQNLRWDEVDLDAQVLKLDDSKTGRSVRPLGQTAIDLLNTLPRHEENPFVFPASRLERLPYAGMKRFYRGFFQGAGLEGVTPHVLRHSFASVGADLGFTDSTIGACLGHAGSGITSRYTHRLDSVLVAAANKIAGEVHRQMFAETAKVVRLPTRA
ncbi:tyrosine-type recombinase/integrase [Cucumibacter marinus]|uniref:tyrosine-type recombinase/integrase n=1 Tax=Cucumibacter marinus TaxID=1121252 RepID=UPI00041EA3AF|nr:site-specific integrase [Cucumibacter marinus]